MRKIKRRKNYTNYIVIAMIGVLSCMGIGYSYLQENLNLNVVATKKDQRIDITKYVVTSGDGLYEDPYENGRYVYRGGSVDNYIWFNEELWRIIAKETDGTYKIVSEEWLPNHSFDDANHRKVKNNTFCTSSQYGCNVYGHVDGLYEFAGQSGTVTEDSSLAIFLNEGYYNGLTDTAKEQIQTHDFYIGGIIDRPDEENDSIIDNIASEKAYTWKGNVGTLNTTDTLRSSTDSKCISVSMDMLKLGICNNNYLRENLMYDYYWTMNGVTIGLDSTKYDSVWYLKYNYSYSEMSLRDGYANNLYPIRPVVYLKAEIQFTSGDGTKENPYIITL